MKIELKILDHAKEFYEIWDEDGDFCGPTEWIPRYAKPGDVGLDLRTIENVVLHPGETKKIKTGIAIWLGSAKEREEDKWQFWNSPYIKVGGFIFPRSGLGSEGLILANTVGVIDENYQGELIINAWNRNNQFNIPYCADPIVNINKIELEAGQRIAQLVIMPVFNVEWNIVGDFSENTERSGSGFGSSGGV